MSLSTFLNGRTATQLRGIQWLALSDTGVTLRGTASSDSGGGASTTFAPVGTAFCRIDPLTTANSKITGGQIDERSTHVVTTPVGVTVQASDRFAIGGRGTFEVTAVYEQTSELAHRFEVIAIS